MHFAFCWCIHDQTDNRKITNFFIGTCKFQVFISLSQASMANSSHLSGKLKILFQIFLKSFPRNICNIHSVPVFSRIFVIVSMLFQRLRLYFLHLTKTRTATWHLKKLQLYCSQGSSVQMYPTMLYKRSCGKSKKGVSRGTGKSSQNTFLSSDTNKSAWKRYQETTILVYSSKKLTKSYGMSFCNQSSPKIMSYKELTAWVTFHKWIA